MSWLKTPTGVFFVRSAEQIPCPCCSGHLKVIGSRQRSCINGRGEKIVLIIRRLGCVTCHRIHHELPDMLVPYKRHTGCSIEATVGGEAALSVNADESTLWRWRRWFWERAFYFRSCLVAIAARCFKMSAEGQSALPRSALHRIWQLVGEAPGWLARVVRPVVNANLWVQTRSAFLS
ncbi:MAG: DUF6431 domain-containing protein [Bacillota bacterium]|nr:DUF6431 domain-containing protein [Bacillota bacterium]